MPNTRAEAIQALDDAINAVGHYCLDSDDVVTDAVLVLGAQCIDDDGDLITFPRGGSQPPYITVGLLVGARQLIEQAE